MINALTRLRFIAADGTMDFMVKEGVRVVPPGLMPWFEHPARATRATPVVFGHWSTLGPLLRDDAVCVDTGCLWVGVFVLVLIISYLTFYTPNYNAANAPITFDITKGESFSSVVDRLYEQGIITSKNNFKIAGFIYGAERKIRAARFHIPNGLSYLHLLDLFISGECDFHRTLTVRPGQTIKWLAHRLQKYVSLIQLNS